MKLKSKLFLTTGSLIVGMAAGMAILVGVLVEKDVEKASNKMRGLIRREQEELETSEKTLLARQLEEVKGNIDALLFLIHDSKDLKESLSLEDREKGWEGASQVAAFDPDIGVLQLHNPLLKEACVIVTSSASLRRSQLLEEQGHKWAIVERKGEEESSVYLALNIPLAENYFALIRLQDLQKIPKAGATPGVLRGEIEKLKASLVERYGQLQGLDPRKLVGKPLEQQTLQIDQQGGKSLEPQGRWALKMRMIELLAPLVAEGLALFPGHENIVPAGMVFLQKEERALAIFSDEVFRSTPIFDDSAYFKDHLPKNGQEPIAKGSTLIRDPKSNEIFLGNTLKLNGGFVSLGSPIKNLAKGLALAANRMVIVEVQGKTGIGYTRQGERLSLGQLRSFQNMRRRVKETRGMIPFLGTEYFFFQISIDPVWDMAVYVLTPQEREMALVRALMQVYQQIKNKIFLQIVIISAIALLLALLLLAWITRGITRPIVRLAQAAHDVGAGELDKATIPDVKGRNDEVAKLTLSFANMIDDIKERETMRGVLNKVISKEVADAILKSDLHLGGEDRVCTILFSDIRGFTELTENLSPQEVIGLLNACMTKMSRVIEGEGGVIDKYVGDEIMALYGAPIAHEDHAIRALSSAKLMIETLRHWNEERAKKGETKIEMGIGIHSGLVVAGNMGAENRLNYTVLGANVNLAARLCQVAKPMQIIISESTLQQENVAASFVTKALPPISLKGFSEPVKIYEIVKFKWG